jgi:hypothetical protein
MTSEDLEVHEADRYVLFRSRTDAWVCTSPTISQSSPRTEIRTETRSCLASKLGATLRLDRRAAARSLRRV